MSWCTLTAIVSITWLLWAVGATVGLWAEIRAGRRPPNAGVSLAPILPLFPLLFLGLAGVINRFAWPWGTRLVGGFHALLSVVFLVAIGITAYRGSRAGPAA
jgi:hypothetical protein